jgi:hypothetical protein
MPDVVLRGRELSTFWCGNNDEEIAQDCMLTAAAINEPKRDQLRMNTQSIT